MGGKKAVSFVQKIQLPELVLSIVKAIGVKGGRSLLVGGYVRDAALGLRSKDIDIEVHRLEIDTLESILQGFGRVDLVGKQFGVLCLHGVDVDWSVPRKDSRGRKPEVIPDPYMGIDEAARRRDLTINSMAVDILGQILLDPFDGLEDLEQRILRATDPKLFVEDPLRFYRVMGFISRLDMKPDAELSRICSDMDLSDIARERIDDEFTKMFLKSKRPSIGLRWIESLNRLDNVLPGVAKLIGLSQDPEWHPEGDVWTHTLQAVDAAAGLRCGDLHQDLMLIWAALCHDLGKVDTSFENDGHIRSPGHAEVSAKLAKELLSNYITRKKVLNGVVKLVRNHHNLQDFFVNRAKLQAFKRMAIRLSPETNLQQSALLALADCRGRNPDGDEPLDIMPDEIKWFVEKINVMQVATQPELPLLMGRHLIDCIEPGPEMGNLLKQAYEIQLSEGIKAIDILKKRVLDNRNQK